MLDAYRAHIGSMPVSVHSERYLRRVNTYQNMYKSVSIRHVQSPRGEVYTLLCLTPESVNVWVYYTPSRITHYFTDTLGSSNSEQGFECRILTVDSA